MKRDQRLEAQDLPRDQKALFRRGAELQGRTLTDFVIGSVHDAAVGSTDRPPHSPWHFTWHCQCPSGDPGR